MLAILDELVRVKSNIRVFHKLDEIGNNANIGIRGFTTWIKIQWQNVTPSGNRTHASPFYTNLTCAA